MTEELKQEAEESAKKFFGKPTDLVDLDNLRIFKNGYIAGATKNGIQWYDLRKDPNDLPKRDKSFVIDVTIPVMTHPSYVFACYYSAVKKWFSQGEEINVIAWCEIPQFKEEGK